MCAAVSTRAVGCACRTVGPGTGDARPTALPAAGDVARCPGTDGVPTAGRSSDRRSEDVMADLIVLGFASKERAEAVTELGRDLQRQQLLDLEDSALVWRTGDGKIKVQQSFSPTGAG